MSILLSIPSHCYFPRVEEFFIHLEVYTKKLYYHAITQNLIGKRQIFSNSASLKAIRWSEKSYHKLDDQKITSMNNKPWLWKLKILWKPCYMALNLEKNHVICLNVGPHYNGVKSTCIPVQWKIDHLRFSKYFQIIFFIP